MLAEERVRPGIPAIRVTGVTPGNFTPENSGIGPKTGRSDTKSQ
jgi:hypothetical protein